MYLSNDGGSSLSDGGVWGSVDKGANWFLKTPDDSPHKYTAIATSSTGTIVLACAQGLQCYKSTDSGKSPRHVSLWSVFCPSLPFSCALYSFSFLGPVYVALPR